MCQRCQNWRRLVASVRAVEVLGQLEARAAAPARSPCPCSRRSRSRSGPRSRRSPAAVSSPEWAAGSLKTGSTMRRASSSATTVFFTKPAGDQQQRRAGQHDARVARRAELRDAARWRGRSGRPRGGGRSPGGSPRRRATRPGSRAGSTSTTYEIAWNVKNEIPIGRTICISGSGDPSPTPSSASSMEFAKNPRYLNDAEQAEVEGDRAAAARACAIVSDGVRAITCPRRWSRRSSPRAAAPSAGRPSRRRSRRRQDERPPEPRMRHEQPGQDEHDQEEGRELDRGEGHLRESFRGDAGGPAAVLGAAPGLSEGAAEGRSARSRPAREPPSDRRPAARGRAARLSSSSSVCPAARPATKRSR